MKKYKWVIILANLIILLGLFNFDIYKKEVLLTDGQLILLELAPVDPRSLMQGDYMNLRYSISQTGEDDHISRRGYCVVELDSNRVAKKVRLQDGKTPLGEHEYLIRYSERKWWGINIGAESFFFQEGEAEKYDKAKFGGIKVDGQGNSLLIGLYDKKRELIQ